MYKILQHGFFKTINRGYYTSPQEHLNFLFTSLNYLPGFMEAKEKNLISSSDVSGHSIDHIENSFKQIFSSTHYQNALIALEKKQFTVHEFLSVDDSTRTEYLNLLRSASSENIPALSTLKQNNDSKSSFCIDNTLATFTRPKF